MKNDHYNKLASYRATHAVLKQPGAPVTSPPALPLKIDRFGDLLASIDEAMGRQVGPTKGAASLRKQALTELSHMARKVGGAVLSYATEHDLPELAAKVRLTASQFRGRGSLGLQRAQQAHDAALSVLPQLVSYEVTAPVLAQLKAQIAQATTAVNAPRDAVTNRSAAGKQLDKLFKQVDAFLDDELDPLLVGLSRTDPEYYAKYRAARIIVDRRGPGRDNGPAEGSPTPAA